MERNRADKAGGDHTVGYSIEVTYWTGGGKGRQMCRSLHRAIRRGIRWHLRWFCEVHTIERSKKAEDANLTSEANSVDNRVFNYGIIKV